MTQNRLEQLPNELQQKIMGFLSEEEVDTLVEAFPGMEDNAVVELKRRLEPQCRQAQDELAALTERINWINEQLDM